MREKEEAELPLASWATIVPPAALVTQTGAERFLITVKLAERSVKTATKFVEEANDALKAKIAATPKCKLTAAFKLIDAERTRSQRASVSFTTFSDAQRCFALLKELGLPVNDISAELQAFGENQYDPWHEAISQSKWPWLAKWLKPAPDMPMMKVTNRLDVSEGSKYKERKSGKLGKSDEEDRGETPPDSDDQPRKKRKKKKSRPAETDEPE